jgi:hypothetical protein
VVAALAAGGPATANTLPDSGEFACERAALGGCDYTDPATELIFRWPVDWPVRRLKIVTQTGPQARARQRDATRWIAIEYWPDDDALPRVSLFSVAVLRRSDWLRLSGHPATADGVEVATGGDHVAIATVPPVNPYPAGSRDAEIYEALAPDFALISLIVRFPERR